MPSVTIQEAQAKLPELIDHLAANEELIITRDEHPVAKLVRPTSSASMPLFGRGTGKVVVLAEDEEHLKDFEDYMP